MRLERRRAGETVTRVTPRFRTRGEYALGTLNERKGGRLLHHFSFNAHEPELAAQTLAELLAARAFRAPSPPFPSDAWFVCLGDHNGSLIEVMPWGEVRDATTPKGAGYDAQMRPSSGSHILVSTPHVAETVFAIAARQGWRAENADAGLFQFIKVWIENAFLVEFLTPETAPHYVAAFGPHGVLTLDQKLRDLERKL